MLNGCEIVHFVTIRYSNVVNSTIATNTFEDFLPRFFSANVCVSDFYNEPSTD